MLKFVKPNSVRVSPRRQLSQPARLPLPLYKSSTIFRKCRVGRFRQILSATCRSSSSQVEGLVDVRSGYLRANGKSLHVKFRGVPYKFHAQWLHDARCDNGASRTALNAFSQQTPDATICNVLLRGVGNASSIEVKWSDGTSTSFPIAWLEVMAPLVAESGDPNRQIGRPGISGWTVKSLRVPEFTYQQIFLEVTPSLMPARV